MPEWAMVVNHKYPGSGVRYVSLEVDKDHLTGENRPILEITEIGKILHISYIRSKPGYTLNSLLQKALDHAKEKNFDRAELQDESHFLHLGKSPCVYRALFYRAFEGKKSIYETKGWFPTSETSKLIQTIVSFTTTDAASLIPLLQKFKRVPVPIPSNNTPFGRWVNEQPCNIMKYFYNIFSILTTQKWIHKVDKTSTEGVFLNALYELREIKYYYPLLKDA